MIFGVKKYAEVLTEIVKQRGINLHLRWGQINVVVDPDGLEIIVGSDPLNFRQLGSGACRDVKTYRYKQHKFDLVLKNLKINI